ncbi:hypothetical protein [Rurimicrobium arvi]|uniref:Uncharacterized protein n=1 Tax=Rurimicrobium arvi TaxID=2049916 RepID=A0ABP8MXL0_9BACT
MMIRSFRFQKVSLRISAAGQRVYFNAESHKDYSLLKGISLSVGYADALYGSTFGLRVDEKEILDESHEAHLLVYGDDVPPNKKLLLFDTPVPISSSKIEGIYTDSSIQGLLGNASYSPGGGVIPKSNVNIKKTYVSGKELVKFSNFTADLVQLQMGTGLIGVSGGFSPVRTVPVASLYYPYDVKVSLFLTR